jgi:hypothetical protein
MNTKRLNGTLSHARSGARVSHSTTAVSLVSAYDFSPAVSTGKRPDEIPSRHRGRPSSLSPSHPICYLLGRQFHDVQVSCTITNVSTQLLSGLKPTSRFFHLPVQTPRIFHAVLFSCLPIRGNALQRMCSQGTHPPTGCMLRFPISASFWVYEPPQLTADGGTTAYLYPFQPSVASKRHVKPVRHTQ